MKVWKYESETKMTKDCKDIHLKGIFYLRDFSEYL